VKISRQRRSATLILEKKDKKTAGAENVPAIIFGKFRRPLIYRLSVFFRKNIKDLRFSPLHQQTFSHHRVR